MYTLIDKKNSSYLVLHVKIKRGYTLRPRDNSGAQF